MDALGTSITASRVSLAGDKLCQHSLQQLMLLLKRLPDVHWNVQCIYVAKHRPSTLSPALAVVSCLLAHTMVEL